MHIIRMPPGYLCGGIPGTPKWDGTLDQTHNMLEGLHMSLGPQDPQEEPVDVARDKDNLAYFAQPAANMTLTRKRWMEYTDYPLKLANDLINILYDLRIQN